jgi:hypothetical protein
MYDDGRVTAPDSAVQPAAGLRRPHPMRDIVFSLGVLIVPLLVLVAFCRPSERDIPTVDATPTYQAARAEARFPVSAPEGLPAGWRATNAALNRLDGGRLTVRVSYLTPSQRFVQLVQSDVDADDLILAEIGAGKIEGTTEIGAASWQRYTGRRAGETALVLIGPESTVIAAGDASLAEMRTLAAALR